MFLNISIVILMALAGLVFGRWQGGGKPKWIKWLDNPFMQMVTGLPLAVIAAIEITAALSGHLPDWVIWYRIFILYVLTVIMLVKGHGHNMDLGTADPRGEPEWYEGGLYSVLYGKIPNYWYDAIGLVISGVTYMLPVGIWLPNPWLILLGAWKAPAYMIGRALWNSLTPSAHEWLKTKVLIDGPTAFGEAFTWAGFWAGFGVIIVGLIFGW